LPVGWSVVDVGTPSSPGAATLAGTTLTLSSSGFDIGGTSDEFTFANRSMRGDVTLIARLTSLSNTDAGAKAGVMVRDSLSPGAGHLFIFETPSNDLAVRVRPSKTAGTNQVANAAPTTPVWLKLERRASTLTASRSVDGSTWSVLASFKVNGQALFGFAVASHSTTAAASATFDNLSINGVGLSQPNSSPAPNVPPTVSMAAPGGPFAAPAAIALSATAADSDGTVAKVDFYNGNALLGTDTSSPYTFSWGNVAAGSYTLTAKVTDNAGATTTSATVSVTVNANTPPAVSLTSPGIGASFIAPASTTVSATASDANGISRVDFYAGSTLLGSDTTSPYSVPWGNVAAGTYVLTAKATDNLGLSSISPGVTVTVTVNQAPTVSLTSPASGTTFTATASVALTASATDVDGTIQKVEFYNGSTLLGSSTISPYSFTWPNVPAGSYSVGAAATDNLGAKTVSAWIDFTVGATSTLSKAVFTPAVVPDAVNYYLFEVFSANADPAETAPVASQNLGVPVVVNGEITVDVGTTISNLAAGNYIATVSSVSSGEGTLRSPSFAFTR